QETRGIIPASPGSEEVFARFGYTLDGRRAWVRDGRRSGDPAHPLNNTATMGYDGHGRLLRTIWPEGSSPDYSFEEVAYGPSGQVVRRRTREGLVIETDYDRLDRRVAER